MKKFNAMDPSTGIAEDEEMINTDRLIDQIERNLDELFKYTPDPLDTLELQRQRAHVAHSLERCRRCGDHIAYLTPVGMSTLCDPCADHLHGLDDLENPGLKWFQEMVNTIAQNQRNRMNRPQRRQGEDVNENGQLICGCGAVATTRRDEYPICATCNDGLEQAESKRTVRGALPPAYKPPKYR